jgi:hypothetical protein
MGSNSEEEHALEEVELNGVHGEDLQEHMVMEESITSAGREEIVVHCMVEDSFKTLCER